MVPYVILGGESRLFKNICSNVQIKKKITYPK